MEAVALLEDLNEGQRQAVTEPTTPLVILAGAGTGKTRVLTRRIAYQAEVDALDPRRVLALTFTRKAAGELRDRLHRLGLRDTVAAGTFHSVCYAQLRSRWSKRPDLVTRKAPLLARIASTRRTSDLLDLASEIEWAKARMVSPSRYVAAAEAAGRQTSFAHDRVASVYGKYEQEKRRRGLLDYDDMLFLSMRDLRDDPDFAAAQRWRYRHLFVDEFQDVNPLQHRLLSAWLGERSDLCVVGDPNQAIYTWNGADPRYLLDFDRDFGSAKVVELIDNYRSTPQILLAAGSVLAAARTPPTRAARLRANRPDGVTPTINAFADDAAEAAGVARAVRDRRVPGSAWRTQAVLVRTNAQTTLLEAALRKAGIPYRLRNDAGLLARPEVEEALAPLRRSRAATRDALPELAAEVDRASDDRRANLEALLRLAREFADLDPDAPGEAFVQWLTTVVGPTEAQAGDAVELATFHAAKGLEWPVVHLAGLERGLAPIGHAKSPAALAEERRLFYVAVTRAERELHCTWARERTFGERVVKRSPSPYLAAVRDADGSERRRARPPARERPEASPADPLYVALREWRRTTARAANVPAYVVFDDKTLAAVVARRPASQTQLLSVPGIGPVKASRYGDVLLKMVAEHQ